MLKIINRIFVYVIIIYIHLLKELITGINDVGVLVLNDTNHLHVYTIKNLLSGMQ